jgi:cystathionine beta-synthase
MTRRLAREEGIFAGNSAGATMAGLLQLADRFAEDDVVVAILHDHGSRYLGKMYNDDWMREKGFLDPRGLTARDLVTGRRHAPLVTVDRTETVARVVQIMTEHDFSQIPVTAEGRIVGSVSEAHLFAEIVRDPGIKTRPVEAVMQAAFPFVDISTGIEALAEMITPENPAVLVRDFKTEETYIVTRWDVIRALG